MLNTIMGILVAAVVQATNQTSLTQDAMVKPVNNLVNHFYERLLRAASLPHNNLDDLTLGKPGRMSITPQNRLGASSQQFLPKARQGRGGRASATGRHNRDFPVSSSSAGAPPGRQVHVEAADMRYLPDPENLDSIKFVDLASGVSDKRGAGQVFAAPAVLADWLAQLQRLWGGKSNVPVADAKLAEVEELLGGGMFQPLFKWMQKYGPVYLLPTGPVSSYAVISDPVALKHILRGYGSKNIKGTISEAGGGENGPFGDGFALLEGDAWRLRRKHVVPGIHRKYIESMVSTVMVPSAEVLVAKLEAAARTDTAVNIEDFYSQVTLDIIGKAVFNYDFSALTKESPIVQAVYTGLKEVETRSMDLVPLWKLPGPIARLISQRQRTAYDAIQLLRQTVDKLIVRGKQIVSDENEGKDDLNNPISPNAKDPSLLRFLLASREEVTAKQLRDDLVSILIAGHETTAAVLTWMTYLLVENRESLAQCQAEAREVLGDRLVPTFSDIPKFRYIRRCIDESMRLYPQPPVYTRRMAVDDEVPTLDGRKFSIPANQDMLLSIYNMHRSTAVWGEDAEEFKPMRFGPLDQPPPNEQNTDFKYLPFSTGPRKCPGEQFALMEATTVVASILRKFDLELVKGQTIGMTSGATIHTSAGLYVKVKDITRNHNSVADE
jgi:carotene epsilon-monooxygenase